MARNCDCSGSCEPKPVEMGRRDFLKVAGLGAAGLLIPMGAPGEGLPFAPGVAARAIADPAALKAFQDSLLAPSGPRLYQSNIHTDARLHLGGIGTGNIELGSDGQFTTWNIFNTLADGYVPLHFGLQAGGKTVLLQTAGGPEVGRAAHITMRGEYPVAELQYDTPALPIKASLTAMTPMIPMDARASSMPALHLRFRLHNDGDTPVPASLAGFVLNPVGYDGRGNFQDSRHPAVGANVNHVEQDHGASLLHMTAQAGAPVALPQPVAIYSNRTRADFGRAGAGLPQGLSFEELASLPAAVQNGVVGKQIIWLDSPDPGFSPDLLNKIAGTVRGGATLLLTGADGPLLHAYADWITRHPDAAAAGPTPAAAPPKAPARAYIPIADFEKGDYHGWLLEGDAFGTKPSRGSEPGQQPVAGFEGHYLVNSFVGGDAPQGRMLSDPFTIQRRAIRLLVGGGSSPQTAVRLLVNDKVVRSASGHDDERLAPVFWDVEEFQGQQARIEIIDRASGPWGHINVDDLTMTDRDDDLDTLQSFSDLMPAKFSGLSYAGNAFSVNTTAAVSAARPYPSGFSLPGRIHFQNFGLMPISALILQDGDGPLLLSRKVGGGECLFLAGPLIPQGGFSHSSSELWSIAAFLSALGGVQVPAPTGQPADAPGFGDYALATTAHGASVLQGAPTPQAAWDQWTKAGHFDSAAVAATGVGTAQSASDTDAAQPTPIGSSLFGAVAAEVTVPAHGSVDIPFIFTWHLPNLYSGSGQLTGNHYTTLWPDARAVAYELIQDPERVVDRTERFRRAVYDSTLPYWLLDCITSQAGTLRHRGVVFQTGDGGIYGWEGSNGCCGPTCTHVWGYEHSLSHLYPDLERWMRLVDFKHQEQADGGIHNRTDWPSPPVPTSEGPFADGHSSCILKAYRESLNTRDESWLTGYWPQIRKAVDYLIGLDAAGKEPDGIIEGDQPNTYDCSIHGANSFIGSYYLAALRAGEEMALRMGDAASSQKYRQIFEAGSRRLVERCWNGEYFQQDLPGYEKGGNEYGPGCLSDQLIGQWWAHLLGLGYLLPQEHVRKALQSVYEYNWLPDMSAWHHNQRWFAAGKDKGLLVCTWPRGGRPDHPLYYCDEVWSGIEYEVASLMMYEGMITEGLAVAKSARDRYDGIPRPPMGRSPWNEVECGGHYARAMSSWSILRTLSGFHYDGPKNHLQFAPRLTPEQFTSFFTAGDCWGSIHQERTAAGQTNRVQVLEGKLPIQTLQLGAPEPFKHVQVTVDGKNTAAMLSRLSTTGAEPGGVHLQFPHPVTVGKELVVRLLV